MAEELQLRVESKLLSMTLNDLKDVAVKLGVEDSLEGVSKMAIIRTIRTTVERNLGQEEEANVQYLETVVRILAGSPPPLEESSGEEDGEDDTNATKEELEKRKALVQQVKEEYETMVKLLKEKEALFKQAQESLQNMSVSTPQNKSEVSAKADKGKHPVNQNIQNIGNILRIKDFKISGCISNEKNRLPFSSLSKQIESALQKGYTETDIIDGVINAVSPSLHLRTYLESIKLLSLEELRKILRSHYGEKSSSESYQELANAVQENTESPLNFLMRALKLRQQVLMSSQEPGSKMQYDKQLVQNVFLHTVETGLIDDTIRLRLRPFLQDQRLSDDNLIKELNLAVAAENERASKMSTRKKAPKPVQINANCVNTPKNASKEKSLEGQEKILASLNALKADLDTLKDKFNKKSQQPNPRSKARKSACQNCVSKGMEMSCDHCFVCGSAEHFARGCRKRSKQGNYHQLHQGGEV